MDLVAFEEAVELWSEEECEYFTEVGKPAHGVKDAHLFEGFVNETDAGMLATYTKSVQGNFNFWIHQFLM